jgi:hypothetical protein
VKNVLMVRLAMEKDVPIVMSVHIHRQALLCVHSVQQVKNNPNQDNRVATIVWLGQLAMGKVVPNVVSVRLLQKNPLLAQHVHRADFRICQANQIASIAKLGNLLLPQVLPPAWIVCLPCNRTPALQIARLVKWAKCNAPTTANFVFCANQAHTVWFLAVKTRATILKKTQNQIHWPLAIPARQEPVVKTEVSSQPKMGGGAPTPTILFTNAKHPRRVLVL